MNFCDSLEKWESEHPSERNEGTESQRLQAQKEDTGQGDCFDIGRRTNANGLTVKAINLGRAPRPGVVQLGEG